MNTSTTLKGLFFVALAAMVSCSEPSLITDGGGTGIKVAQIRPLLILILMQP